MKYIRSFLLIILAAALCFSAAAGNAEGKTAPAVPETNTEYRKDLYPYVVHTDSADWYLSQADIDLMGLDELYAGLAELLEYQEADFADAREALSGCLKEEVPKVIICTDFSGHAEISKTTSAYYNPVGNFIKMFHNWTAARAALLHEYVHYLTFSCAGMASRTGFWAEGIAEYISRFVCMNRLSRSVNMGMDEESVAFFREKGAWDPEEGCVDEKLLFFGVAELYCQGKAVGQEYRAVSNSDMERTEKIQQNPKPDQLSYHEAGSMMGYLIETYGEDFVYTHWNEDPERMENLFGKSFQELYAAWTVWNAQQCEKLNLVVE